MSRMIVQYPFSQKFNDTLECEADSIKDIQLPGVRMECFDFKDNSSQIISLRTVAYALEEEKGIHLQLIEEDKDGQPTDNISEETVLDEIQFCDAIYEAVNKGETAEDMPFIQDAIHGLAKRYALSKTSGSKWFYRVDYDGFGVIRTGKEIIGTIDKVSFNKDNIILDYCVGNINLNKVNNCNIMFTVEGKSFKLTNFNMISCTSDSDFYCSYTLSDFKGEVLDNFDVVAPDVISKLTPYSPDSEEEFVADRTELISMESDHEAESYFADLL